MARSRNRGHHARRRGPPGTGELEAVTADMAEAVREAQVVIVPLRPPRTRTSRSGWPRHDGGAGGAADAGHARQLRHGTRDRAQGRDAAYAFAETGTLPYLTRKTDAMTVAAPCARPTFLSVSSPPHARRRTLARITELFPATRACVDAVDVALTNAGPVIHRRSSSQRGCHRPGPLRRARGRHHRQRAKGHRRRRRGAPRHARGVGPSRAATTSWAPITTTRAPRGPVRRGAKQKLIASGLWSEVITLETPVRHRGVAFGLSFLESAARTGRWRARGVGSARGLRRAAKTRLSGEGRALEHLGPATSACARSAPSWPRDGTIPRRGGGSRDERYRGPLRLCRGGTSVGGVGGPVEPPSNQSRVIR